VRLCSGAFVPWRKSIMDRKTEKENILQFNPANATREQICLWLYTIINCELEKPQEIRDEELIQECSDFDALLFEAEDNLSDAEIEMRISKIKEKALVIPSSEQTSVQNRVKRKRPLKIISVIAAAFLIATITITTIAALNGMTTLDFIVMNFNKIVNMEPGESFESNEITFIKNDKMYKYNSVEDAMIQGELEIMYPTVLPDGVKITQVKQVFTGNDDNYLVSFITDSNKISISAKNYNFTDVVHFDAYELYEVNNCKFYILAKESFYIASCQKNNIEYYIKCDSKDDLILIIDNMKGHEK
jgi:hypothetical protein